MITPRSWRRLTSSIYAIGLCITAMACQESGALQGTVTNPTDSRSDKKKNGNEASEVEVEKVSPPNNIIGSFLVCKEQEQLENIQQNAVIQCGLYQGSKDKPAAVRNLNQWQITGSDAKVQPVKTDTASLIELRFQAADEASLKQMVRRTQINVKADTEEATQGFISDLVPQFSRFATATTSRTGKLTLVWNEGFEGTQIAGDGQDIASNMFKSSATFSWTDPAAANECGDLPVLQIRRRSSDAAGAAEGNQYIDTDSICRGWTNSAVRGPSNLTISKNLILISGQVYRVSFKVRIPSSASSAAASQNLQLMINKTVVKDLRSFSTTWQEVSFDWVAGSGTSRLQWIDAGDSQDSVGLLLDDLRVESLKL